MPKNEEIINRIISALTEKVGNDSWTVNTWYVALTLSEYPNRAVFGREIMPLIPVSCTKCGNTHFINILILGFNKEELETLRFSENA
jgi:hypothetical protein